MKIAITGGTGFIGRNLAMAHLSRGDEVRVLSRQEKGTAVLPGQVTWYRGDLCIPCDLVSFVEGADVIYHCAAELRDERRMDLLHVEGTRRLAAAAAGKVGRWVQLSSVGVYGHAEGEIIEDSPLRPANDYERSKAAGDEIVLNAAARGDFPCVTLRPSIVFGPAMPNHSLFQLARLIRRRLFFYVGPPGASANYIPIDNVVDALLLCATHPVSVGRTYNLSDWASMEDFVEAIAAVLRVPAPSLRLPLKPVRMAATLAGLLPGSPLTLSRVAALSGRSRYPTRRIEAELGYRHQTSLADGLRATMLRIA